MKLYLSSYGLGNHPKELVKLMGSNTNIAIIGNAGDQYFIKFKSLNDIVFLIRTINY